MAPLKWIVRAKVEGVPAADSLGVDVSLVIGQRGWLPHADALAAARKGYVDILSPDGAAALADEPEPEVETRPTTNTTTTTTEPETPDGVQAQAEVPAEPQAKAAPHGPQLKRPATLKIE